jgi:predicted CopG family antitoxin
MLSMRTTLTIDDDVAYKLSELQKTADKSFKQVVNETLRRGLFNEAAPKKRKPFKVKPHNFGQVRDDINFDKISELIEEIEGPWHR